MTAGKCAVTKKVDGVISDDDEMSYLTAFFETNTSTGNTVPNYKVADYSFTWKFDQKHTKYITALVKDPSHMAGEDIEVTKLMHPISIDKLNGKNLITRRLSRGVVADCLALSKKGSTYAISGSPGIGKSWTLIYTLQQALLYENICVLLRFRNNV